MCFTDVFVILFHATVDVPVLISKENDDDYRKCKARVIFQIERFLGTTLEYLSFGYVAAVECTDNGLLQFSHDLCTLDHLPVDIICELHHNSCSVDHARWKNRSRDSQCFSIG